MERRRRVQGAVVHCPRDRLRLGYRVEGGEEGAEDGRSEHGAGVVV
jgi:hypothetical protein